MNGLYEELVERIRGEVPDLDHIVETALRAWAGSGRFELRKEHKCNALN